MASQSFEIEILLPGDISQADMTALQKCEGKIVFLNILKRRATLGDIALSSYYINGSPPDTLALMAAYRRRFPAIIMRVLPGKMTAVAIGVAPLPPGAFIQNTGPFELCNGDAICLVPPLIGNEDRLRLTSCGLDIIFPSTVPVAQAREMLARVVARAAEMLGAGGRRGMDIMFYNGRRYQLTPDIQRRDGIDAATRTLILNMIFLLNEGCLLLLTLIPNLLTLGAQDGYVNAIIQLGSATREVAQLIHRPPVHPPQDGTRRFCVYEALATWVTSASRLGDIIGAKPILRICTFDASPVIPVGERASIVHSFT
ncbi:capsid triplex subunit 2 [Felid alphaherpesvirus 1]|uniref:Capsid triplex subunit 2 n=1 Tax=Feline herpesvirus 1 TaxID=10334 RepID=D1FXW4_FHV1|nr:capsid triplex subunit 2 [Felid alphaherpesvirus 1]AMN88974.1 capsid triplex subunit 2 [synthetic construct]ACT88340.1 capsid triplex subunit 2 [Felid alphaherpesvirus 1]ALJ84105.1 capsid triplex subunit 2 [Felid alphaherpesvirus 1]ALJ84181.1 capsid triplex subunit 2 [Felid alphaherpesvirus 1]ALJ84257.1 capsid triplex subunit 2 [Felid alphaherpesvirus 1]